MTSFNISIQNMTCAGCAGRAERALTALGDTLAIVNLATHSARTAQPAQVIFCIDMLNEVMEYPWIPLT